LRVADLSAITKLLTIVDPLTTILQDESASCPQVGFEKCLESVE